MSTTISSDGLPPRKKKALYHAWHRGTREMDLLLGQFADAHLGEMTDGDLGDLEVLMAETDRDLFSWIVGSEPVPEHCNSPVYRQLLAYHADKHQPAA
jgi:antitoxin CptB